MSGCRFPQHERRLLLTAPGLGEGVVGGLEAAGFASLGALRELGADGVLERLGRMDWRNRRRALTRVLQATAALGEER